jgi:hypothetical protein
MKIWAISWKYGDKSAFGIVGLYGKENIAKERLALLSEHGDISKIFEIHTFEVEGMVGKEPFRDREMTRKNRTLYALEGVSWTGAKMVLLHFKTRLELTGAFLRRIIKQLGGTSIRRVNRGRK